MKNIPLPGSNDAASFLKSTTRFECGDNFYVVETVPCRRTGRLVSGVYVATPGKHRWELIDTVEVCDPLQGHFDICLKIRETGEYSPEEE